MGRSVLVCGAGIAGTTLAYWLGRNGFEVTVVERSTGQRSSGSPVDVRGGAVDVAERMGVMPRLRDLATRAERLVFVDAHGAPVASVRLSVFGGSAGDREVEVWRADLADALSAAAEEYAQVRFGDTVAALTEDAAGVDVEFAGGTRDRFDLVVGADGLHSVVRQLAFGPEEAFIEHLGMYVATVAAQHPLGDGADVVMYNTPGRVVGFHPAGGRPGAVFMFRHPAIPGFSPRDSVLHKQLVTTEFDSHAGVFAGVLDQVSAAGELYCDAVSRVRVPHWSTGRITLVGDAASCVSLFGEGSSNAISGAYTLAQELTRTPEDPGAAAHRYERRQRRAIRSAQRGVRVAKAVLVPATTPGIIVRNLMIRALPG
ncbi:FAD-dependent monooxygenase [Nocardia wallacei]|uniref:FAD-dependent monooxygenase n=1 Tax=Nocardia wallacei TaxID=480035 RepID=UPI00245455F4|nr:FAD-dependent monooxygenase [Nocardia wallacei]